VTENSKSAGTVYLVGAGPGDPGLITAKGLQLLRIADVVLYDRLVSLALLEDVRSDAELIDVGKLPQKHRLDQEEINALMVSRALAGLNVVRLKGGDPFVFGRGGEEALACYAAGVPFVVVPGVSSAVAVPAYAGIPVTHRNVSSSFVVFTGHEDPTKDSSSIDYDALARTARSGTLVLLMGVSHLPGISERLLEYGLDPATPAICIEWGTTERQRTVEGTLETIAELAAADGLKSPATTVIGAVVALRNQGMRWFDER
jgi:uroporphyrinogen III methyltransferase / synthase